MKRLTLIKARKSNGWSQREVANLLGIAEITVRSIENGTRNPSSGLSAKFCYLFDMRPDQLFPDIFLPDDDTKRIIKKKTSRLDRKEAVK